MANITYLLGAGASAQAMPLVSEMEKSFDNLIEFLKDPRNLLDQSSFEDFKDQTMQQIQLELIAKLQLFIRQLRTDTTDGLAKKYWMNDEFAKLSEVKTALTLLFLWMQSGKSLDHRYNRWLNAIVKGKSKEFPTDIKVLTWNYDHQLETAFSEYSTKKEILLNSKMLNVVSRRTLDEHRPGFAVFKLNGSASYFGGKDEELFMEHFEVQKDKQLVFSLVHYYARMRSWLPDAFGISFAWEKPTDRFMINVRQAVKSTSILIVIGYSFHPVNQEIDEFILKALLSSVKKVYVQDGNPDRVVDRIRSEMEQPTDVGFEKRTDLSDFLMPNDVNLYRG